MATQIVCELALEAHDGSLSALPNVVGLGIVERRGGLDPEDLALAVYVEKFVAIEDLPANGVIPKSVLVAVGNKSVDVPVQVFEIGVIEPESGRNSDAQTGKEPQ